MRRESLVLVLREDLTHANAKNPHVCESVCTAVSFYKVYFPLKEGGETGAFQDVMAPLSSQHAFCLEKKY